VRYAIACDTCGDPYPVATARTVTHPLCPSCAHVDAREARQPKRPRRHDSDTLGTKLATT
jgi:hypothetical protein